MCWNLELNFVIFWQNLQNVRSNWSLVGNGLLSSLGPLASPLVSALAVYFWWKVVRRLAWWLQHLAVTRPPRPRSPESRQKQMKTSSCFGTRPLGSFRTTRKSNIISLPPQRCKRLSELIRPPRRFRSQNIFVQFFFSLQNNRRGRGAWPRLISQRDENLWWLQRFKFWKSILLPHPVLLLNFVSWLFYLPPRN